jgi:hypothetical protein
MKSRLFLNVCNDESVSDPCHPASALTVVRKGSAILELLSGKDKSLLVGRDTLLVLDLGLDVVDSVGRLDLKGDRLSGQSGEESARRMRSCSVEVMVTLACSTHVLTKICIVM